MTKEVLTLALEALEGFYEYGYDRRECFEHITAIKEALAKPEQERCVGCEACIDTACGRDECPKGWPKAAQPEQEPVAIADGTFNHNCILGTPLYTTPPQRTWVGLTDGDIDECYSRDPRVAARNAEAKLKEKNSA